LPGWKKNAINWLNDIRELKNYTMWISICSLMFCLFYWSWKCKISHENRRENTGIAGKCCDILCIAKEEVPCDKYLCRSCLRQVIKCTKLQQEIEDCKSHLKKVYLSENERFRRCLPTDAETSPQTAPSKKSARPSTINNVNPKKLSFKRNELPNEQTSHREIQCKSAPNAITSKDLSGVPNQRASELSSSVSFDNNDLPGAICEVQVIKC
jgi:hypothetical protein